MEMNCIICEKGCFVVYFAARGVTKEMKMEPLGHEHKGVDGKYESCLGWKFEK